MKMKSGSQHPVCHGKESDCILGNWEVSDGLSAAQWFDWWLQLNKIELKLNLNVK